MAVIDESVVHIGPDFKGFREELAKGLKTATAGIAAKVKLTADKTGFRKSAIDELKTVAAVNFKVHLVADKTGFRASAIEELKKVAPVSFKVHLVADGGGVTGGRSLTQSAVAAEKEAGTAAKREAAAQSRELAKERVAGEKAAESAFMQAAREAASEREAQEKAAGAARVAAAKEASRNLKAVERENVRARRAAAAEMRRLHSEALSMDAAFDRERVRREREADREELRSVTRTQREQANALREGLAARRQLSKELEGPKLIQTGGAGIQPMNLLYASVVALSPALIAMAANAAQAGTSILALGSAAYGGALAITGLLGAFTGVIGAVKLHNALQKTLDGQTAKTATTTQHLTAAKTTEKKATQDLTASYKDAAQKVRDLRLQLEDLRVQQSGNALDTEEAAAKAREMRGNFFATDLMKRQADQAVRETRQRGKDIANEIVKTKADLAKRTTLGGSPEVQQARQALQAAKVANLAAGGTAPAAQGQLAAALRDLSPAARELYRWVLANTEQFKRYRRAIEQAILPGFLDFLQDATHDMRDGKSAVDLFVDGVTGVGRQMSRTMREAGKLVRTPWFRGALVKLNKDNEDSFRNAGRAALVFFKPMTRLVVAASPLMVKFTGYLRTLANNFSDWVDTFSDADLAGWFDDAGKKLAQWWGIAKNLGSFLLSIFKASLPTGDNLVTRLQALTGQLADWAKSSRGQDRIREFFEFFKGINYGDLIQLAASIGTMLVSLKGLHMAAQNPFWTAMGLLAAKYPAATQVFFESVTGAITGMIKFADQHTTTVASILGLLTLWQAAQKFKPLGALLGKIPGIGWLFERGLTPANPLYVWAVNGGAGGGGTTAKNAAEAGAAAKLAKEAGKDAGALKFGDAAETVRGNAALAGIAAAFELYDFYAEVQKKGWAQTIKDRLKKDFSVSKPFDSKDLPGKKPVAGDPNLKRLATRGYRDLVWNSNMAGPPPAWVRDRPAEDMAFGTLQNWVMTPGRSRDKALADWISARKKAVTDYVGAIRSQQGPIAAEIALQDQNEASQQSLQAVAKQMGLSSDATNDLSKKIKAVPKFSKTDISTPGMPQAQKDFTSLKTQQDKVTGKKTITVEVNGQKAVFATLLDALAYQRALQSGLTVAAGRQAVLKDQERDKQRAYATGGPVRGHSPHAKADNIHAMLTANEYVQPVDAVKHYGTEFMDAVRTKQFPKFAKGGLVNKWPFKVDMSKTLIPQSPLGDGAGGHVVGSADVARIAESTARAMGASQKQLIALIEAGIVESGMRNINYGDRDSLGFLQQRAGWGSAKQRMNVAYATRKFIAKAKRVDKAGYTPGQLAQAVQVSAFPDRYQQRYADAVAILNAEAPYVMGGGGLGGLHGGRGWQWEEAVLRKQFGKRVQFFSTTGGGHARNSWHYKGRAVDLTPSMDIFNWIKSDYGGSTLELIYGPAGVGIKNGKPYNYGKALNSQHMNHIHWAYGNGGLVGAKKYDSGGVLKPGVTMAVNNTRKPETVRTYEQEKALQQGNRLDRRDILLLAQYIADAVSGQHIRMDGRKVAETVRGYDRLPRGI